MKRIRISEAVSCVAGWLRSQKILVIGLILIVIIALSRSSRAQFILSPCCAILSIGLSSVSGAITNVVGSGLNAFLSTMNIRLKHSSVSKSR
jgi:hypothetical protein